MRSARETGAKLFRREYDLEEQLHGAPEMCRAILANALLSGSQAIRLVPVDSVPGGVEYEQGGHWRPVVQIPVKVLGQVINRFKVMAALDIAHVPTQHGELHVRLKGARRVLTLRCDTTDAPFEVVQISIPVERAT